MENSNKMDSTTEIESTKVYIPDEDEVWLKAVIMTVRKEEDGGEITVVKVDNTQEIKEIKTNGNPLLLQNFSDFNYLSTENEKVEICDSLNYINHKQVGVVDMVALDYLHEPALLYNLYERSLACHPYTFSGSICIAVNPYERLKYLYSEETASLYGSDSTSLSNREVPPHLYWISS